ncbi:MAG: hypothetical protein AAGI03_10365 [Pseudomonadota bacterium]
MNIAIVIGGQDRRDQIGDRKALTHQPLGYSELGGDVLHAAALFIQGGKGFALVDFLHGQTGDVFGERRLNGFGIVAILHDHAGHGCKGGVLLGQGKASVIAPLPSDDLMNWISNSSTGSP